MNNSEMAILIIRAIFAILGVIITYYIIPILKTTYETNTDAKFKKFVNDAVKAAEQTIKENKSGIKKKELVISMAKIWLDKKGISMSEEDLDILIESLVYDLNNSKEVILND